MSIEKLFRVTITVNSLQTDSDYIVNETNKSIDLLDKFFYSENLNFMQDHETNTIPFCAGWGFTMIAETDNIKDAYRMENKIKNFIAMYCKYLFIEE